MWVKATMSIAAALCLAGPALAGPALAGPALAGPALAGPALAGPALAGPAPAGPAPAGQASVDALRGERRVFLVCAPSPDDPRLVAQRSAIAGWREGARDRDVTIVQIVGDAVQGAGDAAGALRARYGLPPGSFTATLVGKDGHVALRSTEPLRGGDLDRTIDAMPMRRAGQR